MLSSVRYARLIQSRRFLSSSSSHASQLQTSKGRVIFSGIQPTGIPHLGNYLGALLNWVKLQREASPEDTLIFSIVGWHALTLPQNPKELSVSRKNMLALLLAIGIDPNRSIIFHQDENRCHAELAWILSCLAPMGDLRRMTTWKSRLATARNSSSEDVDDELLNVGLLTYPVLQAADILAYGTTHVPVGEDQTQHIELCRGLARAFNRRASNSGFSFHLPVQVDTPYKRILSLRDPSSKMSKSAPNANSRILITDSASEIRTKIRSAVTDGIRGITYDPQNRPGASNLIDILAACTDEDPINVAKRYENKGHESLKADVSEAVDNVLRLPREEFERIRIDGAYLDEVAKMGAEKAKEISEHTLHRVRLSMGLY